MRKYSIRKGQNGITRLQLNNKDYFQFGPLDQGWWPDGLYTAPTDEALVYDLKKTKDFGYNMVRKHVKVEPARWYTHCDQLGLIVWQDMPNGGPSPQWQARNYFNGREVIRSAASEANYRKEWKEIIDCLYSYPSIAVWVPFNEAWGQFKTPEIVAWTKEYDPSRLVNPASGVLVEVVQLDPIRIAFALEEGAFATKAGQHADISAMKQAWQALIDSNGQRISGELTSVDNRIDPRTASVMLRAEFANPRHQLLPGGNVNVYLRPASEQPVLTLPAAAVQQNGDGFFAWVVNAEDKAEMRPLKVAGQIGQQFQIASGVKPGERAITDGAQRVQPGAAVQILN